ncbi:MULTISPECIES: ABC transporter ATP-binding protein [Pseudomonas]|uniref:ABC transporter ATP-binding protein n=1 Tax=Pseudomonas eucalypticola TaxID=2599595 RepID=A0A7D5H749_9PSED|nr:MULTISPECIES: ABC transporter ATP-binding protein [Pseudomonas]QKZ05689.1 ABC transporter ATP-binding protein [Pseudomonas eucalypticola]
MTSFTPLPVSIDRLTRAFGTCRVLDQLNLQIPAGQFVAILGRSGSGKSTLLRALAGLDGEVQGQGSITAPTPRAVLFQDSRLLPWESVLANVTLGLPGTGAALAGRQALAMVGLAGREGAWPGELSGGEQQRVALARSLVRRPRLLLADEPFGALDALTRLKMQALLRQVVQRQQLTVLMVTHDIDEALLLADRVVVLDGGRIVDDKPVTLAHPRSTAHPQLALCRDALLQSLGVDEASLQVIQP